MSRPRRPRARSSQVSDVAWAMLTDQPVPKRSDGEDWEAFFLGVFDETSQSPGKPGLLDLWKSNRDAILAEWRREYPGTRPSLWWRWDAPRSPMGAYPGCFYDGKLPLPRQRVGGIGTPNFEVLAYVPSFYCGIPNSWVTASAKEFYNGRSRDIHGKPTGTHNKGNFRGVPISPSDPPRFEAQATYLDRHGLLTPAERRLLREENFEPQVIEAQFEEILLDHDRRVTTPPEGG